ncbi:MAG: AEC family transporter [Marinomonas sp.]|uniref:AEC family transporter n=1 Tax=unclassified Marinomonas TaxID=196814 RepID=UPI0007AF7258|nr:MULTISPECIES: AEC family transporter [unclassified Marinomonas]KZM41015.1 transporter [Marinomonas sp. SBI22]KZM42855.1 transporter [Marinomonas sp. SBI8L]
MEQSELLSRTFDTVFPLVFVVLVGFVYARWRSTDMTIANRINMDVFVPALIFSVMASGSFHVMQYKGLILGAAVIVVGSGLLAWPVAKFMGVSTKTLLPPMMFNNSGNLGIPLMVLAFGESVLPIAVVLFLTENLLHFTLGMYLINPKTKLKSILTMPMVLATIFGLLFSFSGWSMPTSLSVPIDMLGQISIPLMLFALGVRMNDVDLTNWRLGLLAGILCPLTGLIAAFVWQQVWPVKEEYFAYLLVFACLPPAVLNYIVSELFQQEPNKVASMVLIGNLISLVTIPSILLYVL